MSPSMPFGARCAAASIAKVGDKWVSRRDGAEVEIVEVIAPKMVRLLHASGLKRIKQIGNLAEDYIPVSK